jgi:hypothetical protein
VGITESGLLATPSLYLIRQERAWQMKSRSGQATAFRARVAEAAATCRTKNSGSQPSNKMTTGTHMIHIDPRDFIMTPYLRCPKCGAQEFGVLSVSDTQCVRRCRACLYLGTVRLPEIKKKIVYIDQFAFSNIMKTLCPDVQGHQTAASEPFWKELFQTLGVVCHIQLVICPDSREHQHESLPSPFYKLLKHTYEHFSGGVSFDDAETVRARQIGYIARCWLKKEPVSFDFNAEGISTGRLHEWGGRMYVTVDGILDGMIQNLRSTRSIAHANIQEVFGYWQQQKKTFKEFYDFEKASYTRTLISEYVKACQKRERMAGEIVRGHMPPLDDVLPSPVENQMVSLQYQFQAAVGNAAWAVALRDFFASGAVNEAPFVTISAAMYASLALKAVSGQKKMPNQGTVTDINIVSTLLPYCDAMFVDNKCRGLLHDIPTNHQLPYPCRVFSPNTGADFIHYLADIRDSAAPEHLKLVEEVYGPDPLKPPTTIYGLGTRRR